MATTENSSASPVLRKEDAKLLTGPGHVHRQPDDGRDGLDGPRAAAIRARDDRFDRHVGRGRRCLACVGVLHRRRPRRRVPRRPADGLADDRGHQDPDALAADEGQGPVRRRRRRRRRRRDARAGRGRAEAVVVECDRLPAVIDLEDAAKDEVVLHEDLGTNAVVHWSHGGGGDQSVFDTAPVIVQERYTQPRLIPNADRAAGLPRVRHPGCRRVHAVSATQIPHIARVGLVDRHRASRSRSCGSSRPTSAAASARS